VNRPAHRFHIVNVFAKESALSGNALAVFEDGVGLSDAAMQAIALQFNLSETTFVLPSEVATARVRIFSPTFELPFAGHPTLGTAYVVRALRSAGDRVSLQTQAGIIPVECTGDLWTLGANAARTRAPHATPAEIAAMLGIDPREVLGPALWVDTGSEQLVVPLRSTSAVDRCRTDPRLLAKYGSNAAGQALAYAWAPEGGGRVSARFFFLKNGILAEDPGTGSACANLGGWHIATRAPLPLELSIRQGEHTGRPCLLGLRVDAAGGIFVSGRVVEIGHGEIELRE
jgi:trans-2,3-dihydro-3-hydroxyanthranilate isomerase